MTAIDSAAVRAAEALRSYASAGTHLADTIDPLLRRPTDWLGRQGQPPLAALLGPLRSSGPEASAAVMGASDAVERLGPLLGRTEAWLDARTGAAAALDDLRATVDDEATRAGVSTQGRRNLAAVALSNLDDPPGTPWLAGRVVEGSGRDRRAVAVGAFADELVSSWRTNALKDLEGTGVNGPLGTRLAGTERLGRRAAREFVEGGSAPTTREPRLDGQRLSLDEVATLLGDLARHARAADSIDHAAPLDAARRAAAAIPEQAAFDRRMSAIAGILD